MQNPGTQPTPDELRHQPHYGGGIGGSHMGPLLFNDQHTADMLAAAEAAVQQTQPKTDSDVSDDDE